MWQIDINVCLLIKLRELLVAYKYVEKERG